MVNLVKNLIRSQKLLFSTNFLSISSLIHDQNIKEKFLNHVISIKKDEKKQEYYKTLLVEGKDKRFYDSIQSNLIQYGIINLDADLKIVQSLKGKSHVISVLKQAVANKSIKTYGIVDDDGDQSNGDEIYLENLFYLKRDSKENYTMDPIHVYFYYLKTSKKESNKKNSFEFIGSIENKIEKSLGKYYTSLNLNQIMRMIYSNDQNTNNLIKLLQLIILTNQFFS
jgi:aspartyl/asparaginyl-tRNA synthetase